MRDTRLQYIDLNTSGNSVKTDLPIDKGKEDEVFERSLF